MKSSDSEEEETRNKTFGFVEFDDKELREQSASKFYKQRDDDHEFNYIAPPRTYDWYGDHLWPARIEDPQVIIDYRQVKPTLDAGQIAHIMRMTTPVEPWQAELLKSRNSDKEHSMDGLDFETYGTRPLPEVGLDNYLSDPMFRALIASVAWRSGNRIKTRTFDFVCHRVQAGREFQEYVDARAHTAAFVAHNAGFERGVLKRIGLEVPAANFVDSAVMARALGADSHLEKAAPQLLNEQNKMHAGKRLIQKWSIPQKDGTSLAETMHEAGTLESDPDWLLFIEYCEMDATLSLLIAEYAKDKILAKEMNYEVITQAMNDAGWRVDLDSVKEMQRRYLENQAQELVRFRIEFDPKGELNFNSSPQLKAWCAERGVRAASFDEEHVTSLLARVSKKMLGMSPGHPKEIPYSQVYHLLRTKQILGGSSLKKLVKILALTGEDGILRNSYMHVGAGQSYRTSGRGVQMQNLKRLAVPADMDELSDDAVEWDNATLAENIRQCFTAVHEHGRLLVGDFSSVESRGLAFLSGESWKLDAYERGQDLYKLLALTYKSNAGTTLATITKDQRAGGKVGELACGYGAGGSAVAAFAKKMGIEMDEAEAEAVVHDWRTACPATTRFWEDLDAVLHKALTDGAADVRLGNGMWVRIRHIDTPPSLRAQHPGAQSLELSLDLPGGGGGRQYLTRVFQGCYARGRNVCYYKPSQNVGGALWSARFMDPKTKQWKFYNLYGGKLAGILTQSFCREIFFGVLQEVHNWTERTPGLRLVGQFHDEIVLDWSPTCPLTLEETKQHLESCMSNAHPLRGFPLEAVVKSDYRYTK